jgi:uncharacterized phage-like protein YoqJ
MKIGITGHRPHKLFGYNIFDSKYDNIKQNIREQLLSLKPNMAYTGMALGIDQIFALEAIQLNIPLIAAIPCDDQEKLWNQESKVLYNQILEKCKESVIVSPGPYQHWKMQKRNEYIVDNCDVLLVVYDLNESGGTAKCIEYARKVNKQIIIIEPKS